MTRTSRTVLSTRPHGAECRHGQSHPFDLNRSSRDIAPKEKSTCCGSPRFVRHCTCPPHVRQHPKPGPGPPGAGFPFLKTPTAAATMPTRHIDSGSLTIEPIHQNARHNLTLCPAPTRSIGPTHHKRPSHQTHSLIFSKWITPEITAYRYHPLRHQAWKQTLPAAHLHPYNHTFRQPPILLPIKAINCGPPVKSPYHLSVFYFHLSNSFSINRHDV